jgi:hypothetical protein
MSRMTIAPSALSALATISGSTACMLTISSWVFLPASRPRRSPTAATISATRNQIEPAAEWPNDFHMPPRRPPQHARSCSMAKLRCPTIAVSRPAGRHRRVRAGLEPEKRPGCHGFGNDVEGVLAGETSGYGKRLRRPEVRFAMDSPLEGSGFEPSVPGDKPSCVPSWKMVRVLQVPAGQAIPQYDAAGMLYRLPGIPRCGRVIR